MRRTLLTLAFLVLGACTYRGFTGAEPARPESDASLAAYYEAGGPIPEPIERNVDLVRPEWERERVLLPARMPDELTDLPFATDPIELLHYRPRGQGDDKRPLIIMSPILANSLTLVDVFSERFAREGFHSVIVMRKGTEADIAALTLELAEPDQRVHVMRSRQVLDWMLTQDDVDPARLGTFGVSAGAILSVNMAGSDARLGTHAWLLPGGPLADVVMDTDEKTLVGVREKAQAASGLSASDFRERLRDALRTDPVRLAPYVDSDRVLVVLARHDTSVPYRHGLTVWRALGEPERIDVPAGHYSTFLFLPYLDDVVTAFYRRKFRATRRP